MAAEATTVSVPTAAAWAGTDKAVTALAGMVAALRADLGRLDARLLAVEGKPPPTPEPTPVPAPTGRITRQGTRLLRDGVPYKAAGMNWDQAVGCGLSGSQPTAEQADQYFRELNPLSMTRIWAMPGMALANYDRIVEAASARGQYLCVTLLNGQRDCTTRQATYETHEGQVAADIADWVRAVVSRHAGNPAVAMFEPANEANEGHANIGPWYRAMAALVKSVDPAVLVGTGGGNNSNDPAKIAAFSAGEEIDLISYHDYHAPAGSKGPRAEVFEHAAGIAGKPWYFGERGFCCGGGDTRSQDVNGAKLVDEYRVHLAMRNCAMYLYWDYKLVQPETSTARPGSGLWRAACDYRV